MQMFFKKIMKIQRAKTMIYITEFDVNSELCSFNLAMMLITNVTSIKMQQKGLLHLETVDAILPFELS